jgi:esterase
MSSKKKNDRYQFVNEGFHIHCTAVGPSSSAASIVFIHGLASNSTRWQELMANLRLKNSTYLLAMDLRGHGHSMTFRRFVRNDWCKDVQTLLKHLNRPTILVGHSLGAQVVLDTATRQADNIKGLVLIDPVFPQALSGVLKKVSYMRYLLLMLAGILRFFKRLGLGKQHYPYRSLYQLDLETRRFLAENPDKEIADLYMNPFIDLEFIPLANYLQDLFEVTRKLPAIDSIRVPVLVLLSSGASTSNVELNKKLLQKIPELEIMPMDADHWLLTEKPEKAREIIENWCTQKLANQSN